MCIQFFYVVQETFSFCQLLPSHKLNSNCISLKIFYNVPVCIVGDESIKNAQSIEAKFIKDGIRFNASTKSILLAIDAELKSK